MGCHRGVALHTLLLAFREFPRSSSMSLKLGLLGHCPQTPKLMSKPATAKKFILKIHLFIQSCTKIVQGLIVSRDGHPTTPENGLSSRGSQATDSGQLFHFMHSISSYYLSFTIKVKGYSEHLGHSWMSIRLGLFQRPAEQNCLIF